MLDDNPKVRSVYLSPVITLSIGHTAK